MAEMPEATITLRAKYEHETERDPRIHGRTHREVYPGPGYIGHSTEHIQAQIGECTRNGYAREAAPYLAVMWSCSTGAPLGASELPWAKLGTTMGACFGAIFGIALGLVLGVLGAP